MSGTAFSLEDLATARQLLDELKGGVCYCGNAKGAMQTFCKAQYYSLPYPMRRALYNRMGQGYEEAYAAARTFFDQVKAQKEAHGK